MDDLAPNRAAAPELLAPAAGLALATVGALFCCVEVLDGPWLPSWFYGAALVAMTAAIYAQLRQRRGEDET